MKKIQVPLTYWSASYNIKMTDYDQKPNTECDQQ